MIISLYLSGCNMFIFTAKITKKKAIACLLALAAVLCAAILLLGSRGRAETVSAISLIADSDEKRTQFLSAYGWEVSACTDTQDIIIPRTFSDVYEDYNKIQLAQGFDLKDYAGYEATRYTYEVTNYPDYQGRVLAELIVSGGRVIGGDIHSTELGGFMHGFEMPK